MSVREKRKPRFHTDNIQVLDIDYSMNGASGTGFWSVVFKDLGAREPLEEGIFLGIVFPENGHVAVHKMDQLMHGQVKHNNWRGGFYEDALRKAIIDEKKRIGILPS